MVSVRDVAQRAGVSISTVSLALNKADRVTQQTRERVLAAVKEIGYAPNGIARSLRLGRTNLIGLITSEITNPFFAALARDIQGAALAAGYNLIMCNSDENPARELELLDILRIQRVAGIILSPSGHDESYRRALADFSHMPMVTVDRQVAGLDRVFVGLDNLLAGRMLTEYLLRLGHRTIGFIGGPAGISTAALRFAGFRDAMREAAIGVSDRLCRHVDFRSEAGYGAARELMLGTDRPTALVAANNVLLLGALQAVDEIGFRCPADVSLAGLDDIPLNAALRPRLTVAAQPIEDIGRRAVAEMLAGIAAAGSDPVPARAILFAPTLLVGGSCRNVP